MTTAALVFVDGLDGSGKSTLANQLLAHLNAHGQPTTLLAVDDFRQPVDWHQPKLPQDQIYYDQYFNLDALDLILAAIANGAREVSTPVYKEGEQAGTRQHQLPANGLILVEGVFTQRLAAAARAALVYLRCDWDEARQRIMQRDQARGREAAEVQRRIDARYFPAQRRYQSAHTPAERADWLLSFGPNGSLNLDRWPQPLAAPSLSVAQAQALHTALTTI